MFGIRRLKRNILELQNQLDSANFSISKLERVYSEIKQRAIEDELIAYCRIFGERIKIETPNNSYEEYFENAILFKKPITILHRSTLLGICYNPKFDTFGKNEKASLLKGRHLGLEGIVSLSYLCGDEAEYQPWVEFGPIILQMFREDYKLG